MYKLFSLAALAGVSAVSALPQAASTTSSCQAATGNGQIVGHASSNETTVCEYLGIPYAAPPVGDLRFAPPEKYSSSAKSFVADRYGADCPQTETPAFAYPDHTPQYQRIVNYFANENTGHEMSEDCLTLNVWSKQGSTTESKPVIVFLHGGKFQIGSSNTPYYNGQFLADSQDVVVVTLNYRINIFGFPGSPEATQNLAFLDHRIAVEWVRDNIAAFGGDASRIIIDGQSSGAAAVDNWAYAFKEEPIVSGLISQSGNTFAFGQNSAELAASNWYTVSESLGCGSSGDTLACMRTKNMTEILTAAAKVPATKISAARSQPAFQGTIDNVTIFGDYDVRTKDGNFARIPYLQGINDKEYGFYRIATVAAGTDIAQSVWDAFELESFTCSTAFQGYQRSQFDVPSYRYRYFGDWENLRLYPDSGAYHGADMEMVIGNSYGVSGIEPSEAEKQLTAWVQGAWGAFARDPSKGLAEYGWPAYNQSGETLAVLGYGNSGSADFVLPSKYDAGCAALDLAYWVSDIL